VSKRTIAKRRRLTMVNQKPIIRRMPLSHYTANGRPKLTHLTQGAAEVMGGDAYRCAQCGLWHTGYIR
jgi:hypothetical protein